MALESVLPKDWSVLSGLIDEAIELPPADRDAWLQALVGDHALHRDTLRALLVTQAEMETDDFLADLPVLPDAYRAPAHAPPAAGHLVGGYRLIESIGRGGMGTVWLAERADGMVKRRVALKLPHAVWGDAFTERLVREREILAALEHPHIARLYDAGVDAHGRPFLAMAHVAGQPIDVHCRDHALPLQDRVELLLQVMAAVTHAHARLVVHRDLKPSNILVGDDGQAVLLDFGIAKLLDGERTRETALTALSGRALTLDYASPEQIRGEPLGTASDIYSLAVVAYELLAGGRPYRLKRGSTAELEEAIAAADPLLASSAAPSKALRRELRGDLDAILHRGLKKSIAERYPSVDAFAQDFERYLRREPVLARPDGARYRAGKFVQRHRLAVAMGVALSVAIVTGSGFSLWQAHVARQQERLAMLESDKQIAVSELYLETMTRLAVIAKDEPAKLAEPHAVTALLRQQLRDRALRFADRPEQLAAQLHAVMLQLNFGNEFEASIAVGMEYLAHLKAHDGTPVEVIQAYVTVSRAMYQLQRFDECEAMRRAAVAWAPSTHDGYTELARLNAMTDLGSILRVRGKRAEALSVLTNAETLAARKFPNDIVRFENLRILAVFWLGFDDARALQAIERTHEGFLKIGSANDDLKAQALLNLGDILTAAGRSAEAEAALRASVDLFARNYGRTSPNAIRAIGPLANAVALQGDTARAGRLLADTLREVAAESGGSATAQARELRRRRLDIAWLSGETASGDGLSADEVRAFTAPAAIRAHDALLFAQARQWTLAGRGRDSTALLTAVRQSRPESGKPTLGWVQLLEQQAGAELAAAEPAAAQATARALMAMLEESDARAGRAYRVAAEMAALAAAKLGDRPTAQRMLAQAEAAKPPFPSRVDAADSALRRGEVLAALGRFAEAAAQGRAALADLEGQHPGSPRLAQAQRLAAVR